MNDENIISLEKKIDYHFNNQKLLHEALIHSSYANERKINKIECNERLEFLGDAVLEMVSSEFLFQKYPKMPEGDLSKLRASLVCETALANSAKEIGLGDCIYLGKGEDAGGGREKASVTSDAFEAVIGAIFLDGGIEQARRFIMRYVLNNVESHLDFRDSKSVLQEIVQAMDANHVISYSVIDERGPEHDKMFVVKVCINDTECGQGEGRNKKAAEKAAASQAINYLKKNNLS